MNVVSGEVPSELQPSQNDIMITAAPRCMDVQRIQLLWCSFLMHLLLFPWQHDLHVATTELQLHTSVLSWWLMPRILGSIGSYLFLTFLYFASHNFQLKFEDFLLVSSGIHKISLPSHIHTSLVLVFHMPGTKVHSHKPPPVSSSGVARSLVLARHLLYARPLASCFAQDHMT